ncbi:hypothetical protein PIB30_034659 [Stylosanthes scabra]|uniref:CCHC-type domain-containing protein n=1 Tax=Stylosanthes scabra TaxID=79078 RepID=A0ABU6QE60_9FABA|nr:hypothetical protein [Stylosanthes scabra]
MNNEEFWYPTEGDKLTAPRIIIPPGRPRKKRTEVAIFPPQPINGDKVRRTFQVTCSKCGEKGHYYKTCKGAPQSKDWQPKTKKPKVHKSDASTQQSDKSNAPEPRIDEIIARARRQRKKMPKKPHVPADSREEIPLSQSAPPTVGTVPEGSSQAQSAPTFVIPVPPPLPKTLRSFRPKQRIFRPPAPLSDVLFSARPAQQPSAPTQNPPAPPQSSPIPQVQPPTMPSTSNSDAVAAACGTTTERLFKFIPKPNYKPPTQE